MTKLAKKIKYARTVDGAMICIAESEECVREINELWLNNTRTRIMEFMGTKPMTKLEEEIGDAMNKMAENNKTGFGLGLSDYSKAAAEVAKRYIEKAFDDAYKLGAFESNAVIQALRKDKRVTTSDQWLKENGITE